MDHVYDGGLFSYLPASTLTKFNVFIAATSSIKYISTITNITGKCQIFLLVIKNQRARASFYTAQGDVNHIRSQHTQQL